MAKRSPILWLEETDSTQNVFLGHISEYDNMSVAAAKFQTAGRGQRGNRWLAGKGENLTFSMLLKFGKEGFPFLKATDQFRITVAATLGIVSYLDAGGIESTVKWPNDIYIRNRKVCGMLMENQLEGPDIISSVAGIGLNVNQKDFPPQLPNPTSMSLQTGKKYILEDELEKLYVHLCDSFAANLNDEDAFGEYESRLYRKGVFNEYVRCSDGTYFEGRIVGVDQSGRLIVENRKGELETFAFKEISYII
jgi:BirA family biotin operon repressor/biotin-[acetyl-CoA-carboxylase] ligase